MSINRKRDPVDDILEQWQRERPDIDSSPMGPLGRLVRCTALAEPLLQAGYRRHNLEVWEFDVLSALRRAGAPFILTPTQLLPALMITSGTVTHRLKQLEKRGLISRKANTEDARSKFVCLTAIGRKLIDVAIEDHAKNEKEIVSSLSPEQLRQLDDLLSVFMQSLASRSKF